MPVNTFQFGSGNVFITPTGPYGVSAPTPYELATLQDVSIETSQSLKELYGKLRMPVAIAPTEMKCTGKAKFARFNAAVFNFFWGGTPTIGSQKVMAVNANTGLPGELATPVAGTFTVINGATMTQDLGVFDLTTGLSLQKVTGTPIAGQYKVTALGVYTVLTGDVTPKVVYYVYTLGAGVGMVTKIPNLPMGSNPQFSLYLYNNQWQGQNMLLELYACGSNKLSLGWKNVDFAVQDFDFYFFDPGIGVNAGFVGEMHLDSVG